MSDMVEQVARAIDAASKNARLGQDWEWFIPEATAAIAAMQADAAPVDDRVSTSSPVVAHETGNMSDKPDTAPAVKSDAAPVSDKLRPAVEVFREASDAATCGSVKYKPSAEQAAAAVIEADRAALVAEIVAGLRGMMDTPVYPDLLANELEASEWRK